MLYPNIWGQGSLFAFSGMEGECTLEKSICGTYAGDRLGFLFDYGKAELFFDLNQVSDLTFEIAASDIVIANINQKEQLVIVFANQNTIVGTYREAYVKPVLVSLSEENPYYLHAENGMFIFANEERQLLRSYDVEQLKNKYLNFYKNLTFPITLEENVERTLAKCFSVMKSQIYSQEGKFQQKWTTPDRLPHKNLWLWDSAFHSMGNVFINQELAFETLKAVFDTQNQDGFIPHMSTPEEQSDITQPPVLAWGFYELYLKNHDKQMLADYYTKLCRYLEWNFANRDCNKNYLFEWVVEINDPKCRCGECGMDNSPRFDDPKPMDCIDFSCFMANEMKYMSEIAKILGEKEEQAKYDELYQKIKDAINLYLWCEEDGLYYDRYVEDGSFRKVKAVSSLLPLFAGICKPERAEQLIASYEKLFMCPAGVSSIAEDDETYGSDMWRGPVWINYNYFMILGLLRYGKKEKAKNLFEKTIRLITYYYETEGSIFEFYHSAYAMPPRKLNRKGKAIEPYNIGIRMQSIRDYGWSAALYVKMAYDYIDL